MKRPFKQRVRSAVISWSAGALNWTSDTFQARDPYGPIEWRDRVRWKLEDILKWVFCIAYPGSDEELRDAEDVPADCRSERQRRYLEGGAA